jgi:hypothetical protein
MILRREILSDYVAFRAVQAEIITIAEQHGLAGDKLFEAKLKIEESLIAAIKRFGSGAKLSIEAEIDASGVKIAVQEAR